MMTDDELNKLFEKIDVIFGESKKEVNYGNMPFDSEDKTDWCKKCSRKAVFIRMAMVCPKCKALIGGC